MKFAIIIAQIDGNYQKTLMQGMLKEAKRVGASLEKLLKNQPFI